MVENKTDSNTGCIVYIFPIILVIGIILFIASFKSGSNIDYVKSLKLTTIDKIQKDYEALSPDKKVSSEPVVVGDYEIMGTATSSLVTPFSKTPCIYYSYSLTHIYEEKEKDYTDHYVWEKKEHKESPKKDVIPFVLKDETGTIQVEPRYAIFYGQEYKYEEIGDRSNEPHFPSDERSVAYRHEEEYMPLDKPITVIGTAYALNDKLYVDKAPSTCLIVSDVGHDGILKHLDKSKRSQNLVGIIFMILGGIPTIILILYKLRRRRVG